jgi:nitrate reductase cytochrome c-type subunit
MSVKFKMAPCSDKRLILVMAVCVALSACTHSKQPSEKKNTSLGPVSSTADRPVDKVKQATSNSKELVPYFNRPPVGTPIETH